MEELLKDDEFSQFIINNYLADSEMMNEEKHTAVCSSVKEFSMALNCFNLNGGTSQGALNRRSHATKVHSYYVCCITIYHFNLYDGNS